MSVNQINHHGAEGQEAGDEHVKEEEHELSRVDGDFKEIPSIAITIDQPKLATWRLVALPGIAMLGMIAQTSSIIGVSLCLRPMSQELSIPTYALQWLLTSASLAFVCTLLFFGRISDIYGHKAFFIIGLSWAALFNLACALAQTSVQFFIFRSMTGLGFACAIPSSIGILAKNFPPGPAKSRAFAAFGAGAPTGNAVGLLIAGLATQYTPLGWRTFFYVLMGITVLLAISACFIVPGPLLPKRNSPDATVDYLGGLLATVGLVCFTFALADGEGAENGWATSYIIALLIIGFFFILATLAWERHVEDKTTRPPLFRLSLWRKGRFAVFQCIGFLIFGGFQPVIFFLTQYWENYEVRGIGEATLRFLPFSVMGISWNVIGALVVAYIPAQWFLFFGTVTSSMSSMLMAIVNPSHTFWANQFIASVLLVTAADIFMLSCMLYVSKAASPKEQGQAGSTTNVMTQLGGIFGLAITTIVSNRVQKRESARLGFPIVDFRNTTAFQIPKEALLAGYRDAQWTAFAFMCSAAVLTVVGLRGVGKVGVKKASKTVEPPTA